MMGGMDLNDIDYDAYLANDRTLDDPETIRVEANGRVRLRIINGAAATAFTIDTGRLRGQLIAVDGQDVATDRRLDLPHRDGSAPRHPARDSERGRRVPDPRAARGRARAGRDRARLGERESGEARRRRHDRTGRSSRSISKRG